MLRTKNTLPENIRTQIAELGALRLADALDLASQAKQAHWMTRGATFGELHETFDDVEKDVRRYADAIAERSAWLGGVVRGTVREAAARSSLPEYPLSALSCAEHVEAMSTALAIFGGFTRGAIRSAQDLGDPVTADVYLQITRGVDEWLGKVEARVTPPAPGATR